MEKYIWEIIAGVVLIIAGVVAKLWLSKRQHTIPKEKTLKEKTLIEAEKTALQLLNDKRFTMRLFSTIKKRVGLASEKDLRDLLVRIGAVPFDGEGDEELWGLKSRNLEKVSPRSVG